MTLAVTRGWDETAPKPAASMRRRLDVRLGRALGVLADAGLLLSLALVLIGWGIAGVVTGLVLGCVSLGLLGWSLTRRGRLSRPSQRLLPEHHELERAA